MTKHNIFITGSKGFIGSRFIEIISKYKKYEVVHSDSFLFKNCNLYKDIFTNKNFLKKDLRDLNGGDIQGGKTFIHFGALSNDPLGKLNDNLTYKINLNSTIRLAKLAKKTGYEKFIFSSSCIMYGEQGDDITVSEDSKRNPVTAYAKSKVIAENEILKLSDKNFKVVCVRNGTIYGLSNYMRLDTVLNNFIFEALKNNSININGDGKPWRPVTHIDDVCRYFKLFLDTDNKNIHYNEYNVGTNKSNVKIINLAKLLAKKNKNFKIKLLNKKNSDVRSYRVNFSRFRKNFQNFNFKYNLDNGINKTLKDFKKFKIISMSNSKQFVRLNQILKLIESSKLNSGLRYK